MQRAGVVVSLTFIFLTSFAGACPSVEGDRHIKIEGGKFIYDIPEEYLESSRSIIFPGKVSGDSAEVVSLILNSSNWGSLSKKDSWEISVLLYFDKPYDYQAHLGKLASSYAKDSGRVSEGEKFYWSTQNLGDSEIKHYFTFDPRLGAPKIGEHDFVVRKQKEAPFVIAGIEKTPVWSCTLNGVHDGIAFQVSTVGDLCAEGRIESLDTLLREFLNHWAKS